MFAKALLATTLLVLSTLVTAEDKTGWTGTINGLDGGLAGTFEVVDDKTLKLNGFTLEDGSAPDLYWWGSETDDLSSGFRISEEKITDTHENEDLTIKLDSGKTTDDFAYAGLWCEQFNVNFGQAKLEQGDGSSGSSGSSDSGSASGSDSADNADKGSGATKTAFGAVGAFAAAIAVAGLMA